MDLREKNSLRWEEDIQSVWQEDCCPNHRWQDRSNWWDEGQAAPTRAWVAFKRCNLLPVFHPPLNAWTPGGQRLLIEKGWGWEEWAHLAPGPAGRTTAPLPPWQTPPSSPREASMLPNFLFFSSSAGDVSCRWYRLLARKWQRTTAPPKITQREETSAAGTSVHLLLLLFLLEASADMKHPASERPRREAGWRRLTASPRCLIRLWCAAAAADADWQPGGNRVTERCWCCVYVLWEKSAVCNVSLLRFFFYCSLKEFSAVFTLSVRLIDFFNRPFYCAVLQILVLSRYQYQRSYQYYWYLDWSGHYPKLTKERSGQKGQRKLKQVKHNGTINTF